MVYKNHRRGTMPIKKADVSNDQGQDSATLGELAAELAMVQREGADSDDEDAEEPPEEYADDSSSSECE